MFYIIYIKYVKKRYCIYPMIGYQRNSFSDLQNKDIIHHDYNPKLEEYLKN